MKQKIHKEKKKHIKQRVNKRNTEEKDAADGVVTSAELVYYNLLRERLWTHFMHSPDYGLEAVNNSVFTQKYELSKKSIENNYKSKLPKPF